MGAPLPHYNGGLLVTRLRHFDAQRRRPGLPPDVAALVSGLSDDWAELTVVNLNPTEHQEVLIQAGGMGEHEFTEVEIDETSQRVPVSGKTFALALPPRTQARLVLGMKRFVHEPSLAPPW